MTKSDKSKWASIIQRMAGSKYNSMTDNTKENLFKVSNAIFNDKKTF